MDTPIYIEGQPESSLVESASLHELREKCGYALKAMVAAWGKDYLPDKADFVTALTPFFTEVAEKIVSAFTRESQVRAELSAERSVAAGLRVEVQAIASALHQTGWLPTDELWELDSVSGMVATVIHKFEALSEQPVSSAHGRNPVTTSLPATSTLAFMSRPPVPFTWVSLRWAEADKASNFTKALEAIRPDPLQLRVEEARVHREPGATLKRIQLASDIQQKHVPDQTALVWRIDLMQLTGELFRLRAVERHYKAVEANRKEVMPWPKI